MTDRYDQVLSESAWNEAAREWTHQCGTVLLAKPVHYSIWDGLFPCSGSGEVRVVTVPYCPTCETEPSSTGILMEGHPAR